MPEASTCWSTGSAGEIMPEEQVVHADLTWIADTENGGGRFEEGVAVVIDSAGCITDVRPAAGGATLRLKDQALLPGFVNAHSHAFQRGLRGRGESFPGGRGSFWTWREAMYGLVEQLDHDRFAALTRQAFGEMRASGITTVGEFHYLHHSPDDRDFAFDEIVLAAAREVGIRIVLLETCYLAGGVDRPLAGGQRRFDAISRDHFLAQLDHLAGLCDGDLARLGVVAHSLRAVPPETAAELYREARARDLVFHVHVEEQRAEIEEVEGRYGRRPLPLLLDSLGSAEGVTAVHCTHSLASDLELFLDAGGRVCICPLTEANLGDGIADLPAMLAPSDAVCLGTDSNARISIWEEMRWLEYVQRLAGERRGVMLSPDGDCAGRLFGAATRHGALALGLDAGEIATGKAADLMAIDLSHASLAGWNSDTLLASAVFGSDTTIVTATSVGGRWESIASRVGSG